MDGSQDILWMVRDHDDGPSAPWRVVSEEEWLNFAQRAWAYKPHTMDPSVPTSFFAHEGNDPAAPVLEGVQVKVADFDDSSYRQDTTGLRDAIVQALKDRILEPANAVPHRRWTDAYDVGHGTAGP